MDEPPVRVVQQTPSASNLMAEFLSAYETLEQEQKNKDKPKFLGLTTTTVSFSEDVDMKTRSTALASTSNGSASSAKDAIKKKESKHRRTKSDSKKDDNDKPKSKSKKKKKSKDAASEGTDSPVSEDSEDEEEVWFDPSIPVSDLVLLVVPLKTPKSDYTEHQILLYRGQDDHIHYMYSLDDDEWKHIDLNLKVRGAPSAIGDPSGYYRTVGNNIARYIIYKGEDDCLHQFSSKDDGKKWTYRNLSKIALQYQPTKPVEKLLSKAPTPVDIPPPTSTTNNPVPSTPEKKNTIIEVFRVAATVGDISSIANVKADMSSTVQDLVQKVMSRFPKDAEQDHYFLLANTKNGPKWLMETQKHLFEYADILVDVQYQLELRKLSKNSMVRAKTALESSPLTDKKKASRTMRLSFTEAKSLQF